MKKFISLTVAVLMLCCLLSSCSSAPSIEDIRGRAEQLITDSAQLNTIFFGSGFETYPRVDLPTDQPLQYDTRHDAYYILFEDAEYGKICAYYDMSTKNYVFYQIKDLPVENNDAPVFTDESLGIYMIASDYTEPEVEYVYTDYDAND